MSTCTCRTRVPLLRKFHGEFWKASSWCQKCKEPGWSDSPPRGSDPSCKTKKRIKKDLGWHDPSDIIIIKDKTLPKAQCTRGLSAFAKEITSNLWLVTSILIRLQKVFNKLTPCCDQTILICRKAVKILMLSCCQAAKLSQSYRQCFPIKTSFSRSTTI